MANYYHDLRDSESAAEKQFEREQRGIRRALTGRLYPGREWTINHLNERRRREGVYQEFVIAKIEGPQSQQLSTTGQMYVRL